MKKPIVALALGAMATAAWAGPADYVYTPTVTQHERELDLKLGRQHSDEGNEDAGSLGLGWGATSYWFTEVYAKWDKPPGGARQIEAFEWENRFQLLPTGKYPLDLGLVTELELPRESDDPKEFKFGPLFQTEYERTQFNVNLLVERKFGGDKQPDEDRAWEAGYQWQVKYRWRRLFEFGAQGFGEVGEWNDWESSDEQSHLAGPAIFGMFDLGGRQKIVYNTAWLVGLSDGAPDNRLRFQVEYEF